ncbi:MAG: hypothetical protein GY720_14865 [bacterium]|nr:hypothetical protein [bacterium]
MNSPDLIAGLLVREFREASNGQPPLRVLAATSMASLVAGLAVRAEGIDLAIAGGFVALDADPFPSLSLGESSMGLENSAQGSLFDTFAAVSRGWVGVAVSPGQLDGSGRTNLSFVGGSHSEPTVALPGSRGLPENNTSPSRVWYVIPKHTPRTLVSSVDFASGASPNPTLQRRLITNLGIFDLGATGWTAASLHDGVAADDVKTQTGFSIDCSQAGTTPDLSGVELAALQAADPANLRALEAHPDAAAMAEQITAERRTWHSDRS